MNTDDNFLRVPPASYNRLKHPSQKQFHDFVTWLRESTVSELEATRGDLAATKSVFLRFFQHGLRADLLLDELMQILPSIVVRADYAEPERSEVVTMLKKLSLADMAIKGDEKGVRFDDHVD